MVATTLGEELIDLKQKHVTNAVPLNSQKNGTKTLPAQLNKQGDCQKDEPKAEEVQTQSKTKKCHKEKQSQIKG